MKNMNKDIQRGQGCNCDVLQEGNSPADHAHVKRITPLQTKGKEKETAPDANAEREARTTRLRRAKDIRPL